MALHLCLALPVLLQKCNYPLNRDGLLVLSLFFCVLPFKGAVQHFTPQYYVYLVETYQDAAVD